MNPISRRRRIWLWILWTLALVQLIAGALVYPVSSGITRAGGAALFILVWFGLAALCWKTKMIRYLWLGLTLLAGGFLLWPGRGAGDVEALRSDYTAAMRRYDGVKYVWGGESPLGIDCSGLIRRGLIDAMFCRGIRTLNPHLVRQALALWWKDCSARDLGDGTRGITVPVMKVKNLNELDHAQLRPGDLAVTSSGVHILAYLGNLKWLEADPGAEKVLTLTAPDPNNLWFKGEMKIVRWRILSE
ncbi:MAG TPA: NlpC/P60 family protein [Verrucomicrobiales bacterium]|jgi:hypothetical protein|nr:NlpC/P60 family protein [Verrucomicrobiales bacterium]